MTWGGNHTVAELREWLEHIDLEMGRIHTSSVAVLPGWQVQDPAAAKAWTSDWQALQDRYTSARRRAELTILGAKVNPLPDSVLGAEDEWQAVLHALSKTPGKVEPGDYQDLYNRLQPIAVSQAKPIDLSNLPQPHATDADLTTYKLADKVIHVEESAVKAAKEAAKSAEMSPTTKLMVGGGVALGLLIALKSVFR